MGKLFLGARSSLGITVVVLPENGLAYPLVFDRIVDIDNKPLPQWGPFAADTVILAQALVGSIINPDGLPHDGPVDALAKRLLACNHDVWIMTEKDVLAGLTIIV